MKSPVRFGPKPNSVAGIKQTIDGRDPLTVVTGATEGIGLRFVEELSALGHDLLIIARNENKLGNIAREIETTNRTKIAYLAVDLTNKNGCQQVEERLNELNAYVDILVNNAGYGLAGPFAENDHQALLDLIDLNVRSLTDLTRRFLPGMIRRGTGGVLNIASLGGLVPGPYQAAYYASKAYVISLTEAIAREVSGTGVRVCVLAPGAVATDFHRHMGATNSLYLRILGTISTQTVVRSALRGYIFRQTLIVPGLLNVIAAVMLKFLPHMITVPITAWLLKLRN